MRGPISKILPGSTRILQFCVEHQHKNHSNQPCAYCGKYNVPKVDDLKDVMNNNKEEMIQIEENIKIQKDIHTEEDDEGDHDYRNNFDWEMSFTCLKYDFRK